MTTTKDVRDMYERYPYPSPYVGGSLILDNVNMISSLVSDQYMERKKILDAGCGTGHRLMAVARRYKKAKITGVDMTQASIEVAKKMAEKFGLGNVRFQAADLLDLNLGERFDIIYSSGVVHHLENPGKGLKNLCAHLSNSGIIIIWLYHSLGEHQRLLERELLLTLAGKNLEERFKTMRALDLKLDKRRYGSSSSQKKDEVHQDSIDADAYMHPIVNAYRFHEAIELFANCEVDWLGINGINMQEESKLIDLGEVSKGDLLKLTVYSGNLFQSEELRTKYLSLDPLARLKIIELILKPTGFTMVAGRNDSYLKLGERIKGNIIKSFSPGERKKIYLTEKSHTQLLDIDFNF